MATKTLDYRRNRGVAAKNSPKILIIDDEPGMAGGLKLVLEDYGYSLEIASTGNEGLRIFNEGNFDLVLTDLLLPDIDGLEVLRQVKEASPLTEVIVITAYGSIEKAILATKAGAYYFIEKPFDIQHLQVLVDKALGHRSLKAESESLRRRLSCCAEYANMIGASKSMQNIYEMIESVAKSDASILIVGESGTGKELIANAIHYNSHRARQPFVKVNCAALPKELMESELFGHRKGAFTGAIRDKNGLIGSADGGSLLLDEIGEMPVDLQPKLLRVLQEKVYYQLGSDRAQQVNFRLITSTNRDPQKAIEAGQLREDLFYRTNTITIKVPPLRERSEDIQLLADHFLRRYAEKYNKPVRWISRSAYSRMFAYTWPGNVRELEHTIERAILLCHGRQIESEDLHFDMHSNGADSSFVAPSNMTLDEIEREVILQTLRRTGGNKRAAAAILGIYRPRLYNLMRKHNITDPLADEEMN